jgi:ADP-ribosyl-[dinitrogen reductase] hydrolase
MEVLDRGGMWLESGTPGAEGNGTAMRVAPLGLFLRDRRPALIAACARLDAGITHDSVEAREGSAIVALAVSYLTKDRPREELIDWLLDCGAVNQCKTLARVRDVGYYVSQIESSTPSAAVAIAATVLKAGGHVVETVPAALFCFLATKTFGEAVELAVRAGGDTDTTAAVTGALAGTYYGSEGTHVYTRALERGHDLTNLDQILWGSDRFK